MSKKVTITILAVACLTACNRMGLSLEESQTEINACNAAGGEARLVVSPYGDIIKVACFPKGFAIVGED